MAEPHSQMRSPGDATGAGTQRHWLAAYTKARHETRVARQLTSQLVSHLLPTYSWPGNIREMRNVLERAAQIAQHSPLTARDLELQHTGNDPKSQTSPRSNMDTKLTMRQMELRFIELVLAEEQGSIDRAAKRLGISRSSLYTKVKMNAIERTVAGSDLLPGN